MSALINLVKNASFILILILSCAGTNRQSMGPVALQFIDSMGLTIQERFSCPIGFEREKIQKNSFGYYLRNFKLHPAEHPVHYYNGQIKPNPVHEAVLDIDVGTRDLQQCADAVMRLRAEYLFQQKKYHEIAFRFLGDGKMHSYNNYAQGVTSYTKFRKYMNYVFAYANTRSLKNQLSTQPMRSLEIGNVLIQSGNPYGHAISVVDLCKDTLGNTLALLAQSYMPAQEIHILKNRKEPTISPWYNLNQNTIYTPEWIFDSSDLRKF